MIVERAIAASICLDTLFTVRVGPPMSWRVVGRASGSCKDAEFDRPPTHHCGTDNLDQIMLWSVLIHAADARTIRSVRLRDGRYECDFCGTILGLSARREPQVSFVAASGKPNVRSLSVDGKEIHHCVIGAKLDRAS